MDDKWAERFARLEAMFLSKSFQLPVEPVKKSDVPLSDRPFIPPTQQSSDEKQSTSDVRDVNTATQPVEVPGAEGSGSMLATRPVEASDSQPPGPAFSQSASVAKQGTVSHPASVAPDEETVEFDKFSDRASSCADEGEVSEQESSGPDPEEVLEADRELTAEQTYRETLRGVRS